MIRRFIRDQSGVVSVEFAIAAVFMMTAMLNAADVGSYVYQSMEVENAAQMGALTALQSCTTAQLPALVNCVGVSSKTAAAVASTSLGDNVTITGGVPTEAYYCVDASNKLVQVGTPASKPSSCTSVGLPNVAPGDYVVVAVSFPFNPMMPGANVAGLLTTPIKRSAIMRVG